MVQYAIYISVMWKLETSAHTTLRMDFVVLRLIFFRNISFFEGEGVV